ncbi:MAG TPA: TraB/VirB10 family protein [Gammaproteobacteria bacterium]|nr:TraB/VirB10 family protein [Gammaproteobacteria bacterium]
MDKPNDKTSVTKNSEVKKKQQRNLMIAGIAAVALFWAGSLLLSQSSSNNKAVKKPETSTDFTSPLSHVNENSIWVERTQNALAKQQKTTETLQQQLQLLSQDKEKQAQSSQNENKQVEALQNQVNQLQQTLNKNKPSGVASGGEFPSAPGTSIDGMNDGTGISEDVLQLTPQNLSLKTSAIPSRNPDTYVPSGTFVRAVMIGGADASAGVSSQSNPTPTLFRIIDPGTLPNHHKSHLKDCVATAAVIGDISSERGQMRLERLSCVSPKGQIIDMPVAGTVFGPEGKNGVRGMPLWREGALLKRAFIAGSLSGLSSGIAQQYTSTALNPYGSTTTVNNSDIFKYGAAQGASNAMDKLADYNIRRADQYHPVIQLSAGTVVDIVFLEGFYLDGQKHDDKTEVTVPPFAMTTTTSTGSSASLSTPPPQTLPLTPQQIEMLKSQTTQSANS